MSHPEFLRKVQRELGEEINPHYVESLLAKPTSEIIRFVMSSYLDYQGAAEEAILYADADWENNPSLRGLLDLGLRLLESRQKLNAFLLEQLRQRLAAIDGQTPTSPEPLLPICPNCHQPKNIGNHCRNCGKHNMV